MYILMAILVLVCLATFVGFVTPKAVFFWLKNPQRKHAFFIGLPIVLFVAILTGSIYSNEINYDNALTSVKEKDYKAALESLTKIDSTFEKYTEVQALIPNVDSMYKEQLKHIENKSIDKAEIAKPVEWKNMNEKKRREWIVKFLDDPDDNGFALIGITRDYIKKQFNYQRTVNFVNEPTFFNAYVSDANKGWVNKHGAVYAKNAFGVEIEYNYIVKWLITPEELSLLDVKLLQK